MTEEFKNFRRQVLVLFFILMTGFLMVGGYLLKGQNENDAQTTSIVINSRQIENESATLRYENCLGGLVILTQYNDLLDALTKVDRDGIAIEPDNEPLTAVRLTRIAAYQAGKIDLPDCEAIKP